MKPRTSTTLASTTGVCRRRAAPDARCQRTATATRTPRLSTVNAAVSIRPIVSIASRAAIQASTVSGDVGSDHHAMGRMA